MDASVDDAFSTSRDTLSELLEIGFAAGAWSLLDVCCMCASSKLLCSLWMQLLRMQPSPTWLLAAVADAALAKTLESQERAVAMVTWLLNKLPEADIAKHPSIPAGLLAIPCIPLELAEQLTSSGVRIPYASIIAAARARVEGVEVWVEAQQIDVPDGVRAVSQGSVPGPALLGDPTQDQLHDLLHLAINSSSAAVAATGLALMPEQLPEDEAVALLQTAIERHIPSRPLVLPDIVSILEEYDHLPAVQLLPVLLRALELDSQVPHAAGEPDPYLPSLRLWQLSPLPVFEHLSPDAAAGLLETAFKAGDRRSVLLLWSSTPAVQAVSPARLADLLQAAATAGDAYSLRLLARLPAFHEVQPAALAAAMMPAVTAGSEVCVSILQESRAAPQLAAGDCELLLELLIATLHADQPGMMPVLLESSASRINLKRLMVLLQAALQHCPASFMHLYQLPAAANIQAKQLGQLLRWAGRYFRHDIVYEVLNWHRAWSNVSPEDKLVGLLQLALQQGANCRSFCVHPCASAVDAELAYLLLHFAAVTEQCSNLEALLLLPAAAKLSKAQIVELIMVAVQGAEGPATSANLSKAAAPAAAAANPLSAAGSGNSSCPDHAAPKQPQQQYVFRSLSTPAATAAAVASGSAAAASNSNAAASSGGAAAATAAAEGSCSGEGNAKESISQPMQNLSLSGSTRTRSAAASSAIVTLLCRWDAAAVIGATGLLQLLRAAAKRAVKLTAGAPAATQPEPDFSAVQQLCCSKAAATISSLADLKSLLQLVLSYNDHVSVDKLLGHCPAAAAIDTTLLGELLHCTLSNARCPGTDFKYNEFDLLALPAAAADSAGVAGITAEQQEELRQAVAAVARPRQLCLPVQAVAQMDISQELLHDLMIHAIMQRDASLAAALCNCRAAAQMSNGAIKVALTTAAAVAAIIIMLPVKP